MPAAHGRTLWGTPYEFRWHTCDSIRSELAEVGLGVEGLSGVGYSPAVPETRWRAYPAPRRHPPELLEVELSAAEFADCGRYILAIAAKGWGTRPVGPMAISGFGVRRDPLYGPSYDQMMPTKARLEELEHFGSHCLKPGLYLIFISDIFFDNVRKNMRLLQRDDVENTAK